MEKKKGYAVEFIRNPPKEIQTVCSVCKGVLFQPKMVDCCGIRFCGVCLPEYSFQRPLCPQCRQPFTSMPDKQLERTLNGFEVYCSLRHKGCVWKGKLGSLSEHLNENPKSELDLFQGCRYQSIKCTRCKTPCQRYLMRNHIEENCSQRDLDCHFKSAGCNVRKPKPELEKHIRDAVAMHLSLVTDHFNKRISQQEQNIRSTIQSTKQDLEVARNREISLLQHELDKLKEKHEQLDTYVRGIVVALVVIVVATLIMYLL